MKFKFKTFYINRYLSLNSDMFTGTFEASDLTYRSEDTKSMLAEYFLIKN